MAVFSKREEVKCMESIQMTRSGNPKITAKIAADYLGISPIW
jgi:hypothetical protein